MSSILPLFPDELDLPFENTNGGSFNEPIRNSDAITLRTLSGYIQRFRIELVGTSRVYLNVGKSFGHLTVSISPMQPGQLIGKYPFMKNTDIRAQSLMPSHKRVGDNDLQVEWAGTFVEICKITSANDGQYEVTVIHA